MRVLADPCAMSTNPDNPFHQTMLTTMREMTSLAMKQEALAAEISTLEAFLGGECNSVAGALQVV